jgi:hypothetical protein
MFSTKPIFSLRNLICAILISADWIGGDMYHVTGELASYWQTIFWLSNMTAGLTQVKLTSFNHSSIFLAHHSMSSRTCTGITATIWISSCFCHVKG